MYVETTLLYYEWTESIQYYPVTIVLCRELKLNINIKEKGRISLSVFSILDGVKTRYFRIAKKAESYFQHTKSTFSPDTLQSMKHQIIAKHLTEPK